MLVPLLLGIFLLFAFVAWEMWGAKYPMFPRRLWQNRRILAMTLIITFISGANFFSVILFWPTQSYNVYGHDPIGCGVRGLPIGFGILVGASVVLWLLSLLRGRNRELLIISSVMMTAGEMMDLRPFRGESRIMLTSMQDVDLWRWRTWITSTSYTVSWCSPALGSEASSSRRRL